ncbi:FxsA family protein [Acidihalobacter ferrooxydans]|uniref:Exlusion protein FxsA n=1 Tax=Acidihalobacter ferrooxydans TaxID=1765967 RepID=A0A1P8UE53_9GAMM|nr:FxsA family protein [Acidihalobacter ferrooxydans]APZ42125.1 hypothetical protein BW247_02615 [Acidihalobacter ferrooxydans]
MRLFPFIALSLLVFPLVELYLLIEVGMLIGALPTLLLVVGTAALGLWLLRLQGLQNYRRMQQCIARGEVPAQEMVEGVVMMVGAVLLLLPGLITDVLGLLCLTPPVRRVIVAKWLRRTQIRVNTMQQAQGGRVYDAEYRNLPPDKRP